VDGPDFHLENPTLKARVGISANGLEINHAEWKLGVNPLALLGSKFPGEKHEIVKGEDFFSFKTPNYEFGFGFHGAPKIFLALHKPIPGNQLDILLDVCCFSFLFFFLCAYFCYSLINYNQTLISLRDTSRLELPPD